MKVKTRKKTIGIILLCAVVVTTFGFSAPISFAATPTAATSLAGKAAGTITEAGTTILAVYGILAVLQAALAYILSFASFILDNLFFYNTILVPGNIGVVGEGWVVMRDVANAFFILILLWIAFTIIFNIENYGGKKLLARVIVVALLINFSLIAVSSVFSFANALARPFQTAIGNSDIAGLIIGKIQLQTITNSLDQAGAEQLKTETAKQAEQEPRKPKDVGVTHTFLTPVQPHSAYAQRTGGTGGIAGILGCGIGALLGAGVASAPGCVAGSLAFAALDLALSTLFTAGAIAFSWKAIPMLLISDIFLLITIFAFTVASVVLLARLVAMTFLAVLAPAALMFSIIPGKLGGEWWDKWVKKLVSWAFFAPAFYFLLWLSLIVLDNMSSVLPKENTFSGSTSAVLVYVVFLGFLFGAIRVAHEMGITIADRMVAWGKGIGWGALGYAGGLATAGLKNMGQAVYRRTTQEEGRVHRGLRMAADTPGLRWITALPRKTYLEQLEARKKEVEDLAAKSPAKSKPDKIAAFREAFLAKDIAAATINLGADIKELRPEEIQKALRISSQFGTQQKILKIFPDLATKDLVPGAKGEGDAGRLDAITQTIKRTAPNEAAEMSETSFTVDTGQKDENGKAILEPKKEVIKAIVENKGPEFIKQMARSKNEKLAPTFIDMLNKSPELGEHMSKDLYRFLTSNAGRAIGLRLSPKASRPPAIIEEERERQRVEDAKEESKESKKKFERATRELDEATKNMRDLQTQKASFEERAPTMGAILAERERKKIDSRIRELSGKIERARADVNKFAGELERAKKVVREGGEETQ